MNEPIAAITVLVIAVTTLVSYRAFQSPALQDSLLFSTVPILRDKQYRRLITSGFIHSGWPHLLFNMFSLFSFGKYIELVYGAPTMLLIYFVSIVGGNLVALYLHRHHEYEALGASGGVCGVIFAAIFLLPGGGVVLFMMPFAIPNWAFAILFILGSFYGIRAGCDNIGHDAHLGGALVGVAVATILRPRIVSQNPVLYFCVVVLSVAALAYTFKFPPSLYPESPYTRAYWQRAWSDLKNWAATRGAEAEEKRLDDLLELISRGGMDSLTPRERGELEAISQKKKELEGEG